MSEGPPHRMPGSAVTLLSHADLCELRQLYDHLSDASAAAGDALTKAGAIPTAAAFQRYEALDARMLEIFHRIKKIIG